MLVNKNTTINPLVSVIVPIYNTQKYLYKCVNSILNQTYKNLDIILVDDGSSDKCGAICDDYKKIDNRIKVIHQKNSGVSIARNNGLSVAKGEYVTFVDSDDYVLPLYIEFLLVNMIENNADISACSYQENEKRAFNFPCTVIEDMQSKMAYNFLKKLAKRREYLSATHQRLFKMNIIKEHKIKYPECIRFNEDRCFILEYLTHVKKAVFSSEPLYIAVPSDTSVTRNTYGKENIYFDLDKVVDIYQNIIIKSPNKYHRDMAKRFMVQTSFFAICCCMQFMPNFERERESLRSIEIYLLKIFVYFSIVKRDYAIYLHI